jgi:hypothetical protein
LSSRRVHATFSAGKCRQGGIIDDAVEAERLDPGGCGREFGGEVSQVLHVHEDEMIPCEDDVDGGVSHGPRYEKESCVHVVGDRATRPPGLTVAAAPRVE